MNHFKTLTPPAIKIIGSKTAYRTSLVKFKMRSRQILGCLSQSNFNIFSYFNGEFLKFRIRLKNLEIGS